MRHLLLIFWLLSCGSNADIKDRSADENSLIDRETPGARASVTGFEILGDEIVIPRRFILQRNAVVDQGLFGEVTFSN
jgi:hypothetical protein